MMKLIEELSMNAWPALQTKLFDGWVLRFADGYTKRSNSINPLYDSCVSLKHKIDFCEKEYESKNLPVVYKLTLDSNPKNIDLELDKRGYSRIDETSMRLLQISKYNFDEIEDVSVMTGFCDAWIESLYKCSGMNLERDQITAKRMLDNIKGEVVCVNKIVDGKIVGCGYGVIERDYIGIFYIVVDKSYRRMGFGRDIMKGILNIAQHKEIGTAYLQVVVGNTVAENLYESLGFIEEYRYWYRVKKA